jgi:hypothetical protein
MHKHKKPMKFGSNLPDGEHGGNEEVKMQWFLSNQARLAYLLIYCPPLHNYRYGILGDATCVVTYGFVPFSGPQTASKPTWLPRIRVPGRFIGRMVGAVAEW